MFVLDVIKFLFYKRLAFTCFLIFLFCFIYFHLLSGFIVGAGYS